MMNVLALTRATDTCFYYRLQSPFKYINRDKFQVHLDLYVMSRQGPLETDDQYGKRRQQFFDATIEKIKKFDLIIFQRAADDFELKMIETAIELGKKVIYESDDDYLHVPAHNPGHVFFANRQVPVRKMLQKVHMITVSTDELGKTYGGFNDNIVTLPNSIDFHAFDEAKPSPLINEFVDCEQMPCKLVDDICMGKLGAAPQEVIPFKVNYEKYKAKCTGKKVILWSGSPTHLLDIDQIVEAMTTITQTRDDIIFVIGGYAVSRLFRNCQRRSMFLIGLVPMKDYYGTYKAIDPDIILAPVLPDKFNRAKSNLRIIESMAFQAYPIATRYVTYEQWINKGALAYWNAKSWTKCITDALAMPKEQMGEVLTDNERYVREQFSMQKNAALWEKAYESLF